MYTDSLQQTGRPGMTRRLATGMGLVLTLLCMHKANATHPKSYTYDVCQTDGETTTVTHVVGTFTKNTPAKGMLTDWIEIPPHVLEHARPIIQSRYPGDSFSYPQVPGSGVIVVSSQNFQTSFLEHALFSLLGWIDFSKIEIVQHVTV